VKCNNKYYAITNTCSWLIQEEVDNSFHTPAFSLIKSLVMTTGELEYEQVFRFRDSHDDEPPGALNFIAMSNILWIVFVIIMPLLFVNLLVSGYSYSYLNHKVIAKSLL